MLQHFFQYVMKHVRPLYTSNMAHGIINHHHQSAGWYFVTHIRTLRSKINKCSLPTVNRTISQLHRKLIRIITIDRCAN